MNYRSVSDLNEVILRNIHIIPRDIDLVVGVPRSGMMPANLLSLYLNLPYTDIHILHIEIELPLACVNVFPTGLLKHSTRHDDGRQHKDVGEYTLTHLCVRGSRCNYLLRAHSIASGRGVK